MLLDDAHHIVIPAHDFVIPAHHFVIPALSPDLLFFQCPLSPRGEAATGFTRRREEEGRHEASPGTVFAPCFFLRAFV
jgi:hypothetical protein